MKKGGLWKLLRSHIGRDVLTAWCTCHRSDLALESVQAEVSELSIWMTNVLSLVSFSEHLQREESFYTKKMKNNVNLLNPVLHSLEAAEKMFLKIISGIVTSERKERNMAQGLLSKWKADAQQFWLAVMMYGLCILFQRIQRLLQRSDLLLSDIITA